MSAGSTLTVEGVAWQDYEQLLEDLGDSYGVRIAYDRGRLEIMSPSLNHEMYKELLLLVASLLADEMGLLFESRGSVTIKQEDKQKAAEPDTCFYVQNAAAIVGKKQLDLSKYPAPDIVVEVDVSHSSTDKLSFYAGLGIGEMWRYDEQHLRIYQLAEGKYVEVPASSAFPLLTSEILTDLLDRSKTEGQSGSLRWFRKWLRDQS
jgi:Uma2 family endonuclease